MNTLIILLLIWIVFIQWISIEEILERLKNLENEIKKSERIFYPHPLQIQMFNKDAGKLRGLHCNWINVDEIKEVKK
jgi:hypothetical protein